MLAREERALQVLGKAFERGRLGAVRADRGPPPFQVGCGVETVGDLGVGRAELEPRRYADPGSTLAVCSAHCAITERGRQWR